MSRRVLVSIAQLLAITLLFAVAAQIGQAQSAVQPANFDRLTAEFEPEVKRAMEAGKIPSCTIALVADGRVVWRQAYGYSNVWSRTPAKIDSVYLIGSTFKAMSTVALLQLMEQGKFKLDDPVSAHLSEFKIQGEDPKQPVTFRHLLTHVSGMPADFGPFPLWGDANPPDLGDYLKTSLKVTAPPLQKEVYSNLAYSLIGYLVEKLSGKPFKQYIRENIFAPLEMRDTEFNPRPDMDERLATPYVVDEKTGEQKATTRLRAQVWPAGLVYGTIHDQANWLIANLNGGEFGGKRLLDEATHKQMLTKQYPQFPGPVENLWGSKQAGFGLTWWVDDRDGDLLFAHSGSVPGYTAFLLGNRTRKLGFAILTNGNRAHPHLIKLADKAMELLKAQPAAGK